jgi:dTDP-glucose 4,6-dehydratase
MMFITGGAGFIGANFVLGWLAQCDESVINLATLTGDPQHVFVYGDMAVCERPPRPQSAQPH